MKQLSPRQRNIIIAAAAGTLAAVAICFLWPSSATKKVAMVGDYPLTKGMVDNREKVAKIYYPNEKTKLGLRQLVRAYTYAQILRNHGRPITEQELQREEHRIEANTRNPDGLNKIKAVFGKNHEAYVSTFILPNYVERIFYHEFFLNSPQVQDKAHQAALEFLQEALRQPARLTELAQQKNLQVSNLILDPQQGISFKDLEVTKNSKVVDQSPKAALQNQVEEELKARATFQQKEEARRWFAEIIPSTRPGAVYKNLIDYQDGWLVLRFLKKEKSKPGQSLYSFQSAFVPKVDFSTWLKTEEAKIKVQILQQ